jgi:hypothetical protein
MDFRPLRRRDNRLLFAAQAVSIVGSMMITPPCTASVVSGGVLCVIGVIGCGLALPRFVGYDARRPPVDLESA